MMKGTLAILTLNGDRIHLILFAGIMLNEIEVLYPCRESECTEEIKDVYNVIIL